MGAGSHDACVGAFRRAAGPDTGRVGLAQAWSNPNPDPDPNANPSPNANTNPNASQVWRKPDFNASSATLDRENAQLWARSEDVERCGYFVSHAWDDEDAERHPGKKVLLIRVFL